MSKKFLPGLAIFLFTAISVELIAFTGVQFLKRRLVFYNPPSLSTYHDYMENRDPLLGWPSKRILREKYDASGSRPIPSFPTPGNSCISLYGDSFTWSDSVDDAAAWSNQLSLLRNCRVSNYGVSGYGTDQALLRFEQKTQDDAPIVLLNHFTGDIRRNVTQFRNLTSDDDYFLLKPRFVFEGEQLKLIPLISPTFEEAKRIADDPGHVLPYEYFAPGGPAGIVNARFPYTASLIRAFGNEHLQAKFRAATVWEAYYREDHQSGALPLTVAIMKRFSTIAVARRKRPIVTVIPNAHDIHAFQRSGRWPHQPLIDLLSKTDIEVFDFGPGIVQRLQQRDGDICNIMEKQTCYGHYNEEGYRILAELADKYLRRPM